LGILASFLFLEGHQMPNNLYANMTKKFSMEIKMPFKTDDGGEITLPMVVLSGRELFEAKQNAEADTRKSYGKDLPKKDEASDFDNKYCDQLAYWTIYYSVREPGDLTSRFFPTKDAVMDSLTSDQAGILSNNYMTLQLNQPWLMKLDNDDPEKLESLVQQIIQDGKDPHFFLSSLTSHALNILINFMGAKLMKLQMENGSLTEQLNAMQTK
jgi:hypothetical protein